MEYKGQGERISEIDIDGDYFVALVHSYGLFKIYISNNINGGKIGCDFDTFLRQNKVILHLKITAERDPTDHGGFYKVCCFPIEYSCCNRQTSYIMKNLHWNQSVIVFRVLVFKHGSYYYIPGKDMPNNGETIDMIMLCKE